MEEKLAEQIEEKADRERTEPPMGIGVTEAVQILMSNPL